MHSARGPRRAGIVVIRDDQIASLNPALQLARQDLEAGELDGVYPIYVLDDETIAETRPSLCRLHYLFFRLWRLGERIRMDNSRLEFRQGDLGYQVAQYVSELNGIVVYTTDDTTDLGRRQTERLRRALGPVHLMIVPPRPGVMNEEQEAFEPYWELFNEEELEEMGL